MPVEQLNFDRRPAYAATRVGQNKFVDQYDSEDEYRGRPGVPVDFGRLLHALKRHWRALPIAAALGALAGLAVAALVIKPSYTSRATIMWEPSAEAEPSDRSFLTQVDSIKLPVNLMEVRKRLGSKAKLDELKEKINLLFDGQSHLVVVEVTDSSGKGAAKFANTIVEVFLEYQRKIGQARGSERLKAIETDIEVAQKQLAEQRAGFEAFRKEMGISDFSVETKLAIEKVESLRREAVESETMAGSEAARQAKLKEAVASTPAVVNSGSVSSNPDELELRQLQTKLVEKSAHLAADHPEIIQLKAQIAGLEQRVKSNPKMVTGSVTVAPNTTHVSLTASLK
ncbi:MAG TPA: Wzz/FepE/Etk N-terminal domain-containing protein, partial [Polyangiales bacterium]|nr:Wzz/FepE/Etk N-terminal domain-containing protein [Polyangiales bacterium]